MPIVTWEGFFLLKFQHNQRNASLMVEMQAPQQALGPGVRVWWLPGSSLDSRIWGTRVKGGGKNHHLAYLLLTWLILRGPRESFQSPIYLRTCPNRLIITCPQTHRMTSHYCAFVYAVPPSVVPLSPIHQMRKGALEGLGNCPRPRDRH